MTTSHDEAREGDSSAGVIPPDVRRASLIGVVRASALAAILVTAYVLLPLDRLAHVSPAITLPLALVGFVVALGAQVRAITRATYPGVRAIEALGTSVTLLMVIFASTYYVMSVIDTSSFTQPLTKLDSLYFTVTVFATVGFGDIAARAESARGAVTVQMVVDLLVIGIGLRLILGAVRQARTRVGGSPGPA